MHVLKFTLGGEPPESIFCDETIGFGDSLWVSETSLTIYETLGLRDVIPDSTFEVCYETIGFGEDDIILRYEIVLYDTIGFHDSADESLKVYCAETIGFGDSLDQDLDNHIMCIETIGFGISGYHEMYVEHDITFTWRTRTNSNGAYGYGASEYGAIVSYGDGDAANLASFEIHIWKVGGPDSNRYLDSDPAGEFDERLTKQVIPIVDTGDPDADATYTLTIANNKTYGGGVFTSDIEAEIFVKDENGVYSFSKIIITDTLKVNHEE